MHFSINNMRSVKELIEYSQRSKEIEEWEKAKSIVYIINMYDENDKCVFTKIGKSKNILRRFQKLERQYYATQDIQIARIEPVYVFNVKNDDLAQVLESFIRNLFRKTHDFIPNDRFKPFTPSEEEWKEMERYYKLVCTER